MICEFTWFHLLHVCFTIAAVMCNVYTATYTFARHNHSHNHEKRQRLPLRSAVDLFSNSILR